MTFELAIKQLGGDAITSVGRSANAQTVKKDVIGTWTAGRRSIM